MNRGRPVLTFHCLALLIVLSTAMVRPCAGAGAPLDLSSRLRDRLVEVAPPGVAPGAVAVVARDGIVVGQATAGYANVASRVAMTTHTVFDLASCSKQFTAMAVMILAERGKLSFDDDARRFLPELAKRDPPIRVSDLLHMTSGLPDYEKLLDHLEDKSNIDVLNAVARRPLLFAVGTQYNYSDTNYVLLALIVERASGRSFAQFLKQSIFDPAGMKQALVLERPGQAVPGRAEGYARGKEGIHLSRQDTRTYGDGQVMASAEDLLNWDRALRENRLVSREMLARAFTSGRLTNGKPCGYGFGWAIPNQPGLHRVEHAGGWAGTSTYILRDLETGITVIVLSNIEKFPVRKLGDEFADLARGSEASVMGAPHPARPLN
jgi:CubicO group peptidase (beta-lactamase class C family)